MKILNCTIRLGGELLHTVPKERVSEREIRLLKHIHGSDAVVDVKHIGDIEVPANDEYKRLARFYSLKAVEECFDVRIDDFADWLESQLAHEDAKRFEANFYASGTSDSASANAATSNESTESVMTADEMEAEIERRVAEALEAAAMLAASGVDTMTAASNQEQTVSENEGEAVTESIPKKSKGKTKAADDAEVEQASANVEVDAASAELE